MPRPDGRTNDELRPIALERAANPYAEGSCLVRFGGTLVHCTASVEAGVPPFKKGSGEGWVTAEYAMLPRATLERTSRERNGPGGRSQEIQRLIGRSLRAAHGNDGLWRVHHQDRLRRAPGRWRHPDGQHYRRLRGAGRCLRMARGQDRDRHAVRQARRGGLRGHRGRRAAAGPRLPGRQRRRGGRQHGDDRARPVRRSAGHRRERHLLPRRARRHPRPRQGRDRAALHAFSGRRSAGEARQAARRHPQRREAARGAGPPRGRRRRGCLSVRTLGLAETSEESLLELGDSFEDNARAKAEYFAKRSGLPTVADDSGLEVFALGGEPGVRSKRWAAPTGKDADVDAANNAYLLRRLHGAPEQKRRARYRCVLVYVPKAGAIPQVFDGTCTGRILEEPQRHRRLRLRPPLLQRRPRQELRRGDGGGKACRQPSRPCLRRAPTKALL